MKTQVAQAASQIRKELKANFPGVKFSVRSQNYSMGDNINVSWTDGPKVEAVEEITGKYQAGSFNGMEDIYEYDNSNDDLPQTKYLFTERTASEETETFLRSYVENKFPQSNMCEWEYTQFKNREYRAEFSKLGYPELMFAA